MLRPFRTLIYIWTVIILLGMPLLAVGQPAGQVGTLINGYRTHAGATNYALTTGSVNAYLLTLNEPIPAYAEGSCYLLKLHAANTGPATLNVNGEGTKPILKFVAGGSTSLAADDFGLGQVVEVCYDGTNMQAQLGGGGGGGGGSGDVGAVGSCTSGDCFTAVSPSASLVFNNPTSGTVTLQTVPGALGTRVQRFKAETGDICTDGSVCTGYQASLPNVTNDAQLKRAAGDFAAFTQKAVPVSTDRLLIEDSAAAGGKKWIEIAALPTGAGGAGDLQAVGTCASGDCFTSGVPSTALFFQATAAPSTPATGSGVVYVDTATKNLAVKDDAGSIKHGVQTKAAVPNEFVTAISAAGVVTSVQPTFANVAGTSTCAQQPALTGQVTAPAGSCVTTVASLPTALPAAGSIIYTAIAAPATPAAGTGVVYIDSTTKNLAVKDDAGVVKHGVQTKAATPNEFVTAIGPTGVVTSVQPNFTNLAGTPTLTQTPATVRAAIAITFANLGGS